MAAAVASKRLHRHWRQADHSQRRALITDVAMALLERHGVRGVTMRKVAQRLGVGAMTLYTYIDSQETLLLELARLGFQLLNAHCEMASTLGTPLGWRGGASAYVDFARRHPNLYDLMFSAPSDQTGIDIHLLNGGFSHLLDKVKTRLARRGLQGEELDRQARAAAGRFWIGLHGLASLAISGRLAVLGGDVDRLLQDLLQRISPD